jgi:predicted secreted protein
MSHHEKIKERTNTFAFRTAAEDGAAADKGVKNKHVSAARRCPAATRSSARTARSCKQNLRLPRRFR